MSTSGSRAVGQIVMRAAIAAYEVPPEEDERFLASWERAAPPAVLHRALRADVDFRFVTVGAASAELPFPAHAGEYEIAREDGTPDVAGGVVLVNPFEVPEGDDERFLAGWERARGTLAPQRGYLGTRLHRAAGPADFRFVNVARWSSPLMFARALKEPEFAEAARAIPFVSHPALYLELT
jgi:heme-degrading monooxygenase HmoA